MLCGEGPGQREVVDQRLVHRAGVQVAAGRGAAGDKVGVSQRPRAAPPSTRAAPYAPRPAARPAPGPPSESLRLHWW